ECVRPGADRLVRQAAPVGEVMAALMARAGPVADLVPLVPGSRQPAVGDLVHRRGAVVVLAAPRLLAPAACAGTEREVVPGWPRQPLCIRVVERQRVQRQVI